MRPIDSPGEDQRRELSGFVSSNVRMEEAVKVAQAVGGVTSVKNDMRVK